MISMKLGSSDMVKTMQRWGITASHTHSAIAVDALEILRLRYVFLWLPKK
jgi:hypothetical protein